MASPPGHRSSPGIEIPILALSPEEYLEGEQYSEIRHEYVSGQVYTMVGASEPHNLIAGNLYTSLRSHLRGSACRVFMADMKVQVANAFYYPNILVTCDRADTHLYYKTAPVLTIEVLSAATEKRDTGEKRLAYQSLATLQEYGLVAQDKIEAQICRRTPEGWDLEICAAGDELQLNSVGLAIPIETVYEDV